MGSPCMTLAGAWGEPSADHNATSLTLSRQRSRGGRRLGNGGAGPAETCARPEGRRRRDQADVHGRLRASYPARWSVSSCAISTMPLRHVLDRASRWCADYRVSPCHSAASPSAFAPRNACRAAASASCCLPASSGRAASRSARSSSVWSSGCRMRRSHRSTRWAAFTISVKAMVHPRGSRCALSTQPASG